jgi:sulfur-oxidizing protein SoxX
MSRTSTIATIPSLLLACALGFTGTALADDVAEGKQLAFDRKKGNCLACHSVADGVSPGNIGPPLIAMKARFPDIQVLRQQIWDPTVKNPQTIMPPFGKHGIVTEDELDKIVAYIYTL